MKRINKLESILLVITAVLSVGVFMANNSFAEQSGESPESGVDSVLKKTYDDLKNAGYGNEEGSNGAMWNRIISSANWNPSGNATEDKVFFWVYIL